MTHARPYRHASRKQMIQCNDRLRDVLTVDKGLCEYTNGHSDLSIGAELGITENSVRGVRIEMFGKLRPAMLPTATMELHVAELRQDVNVIIDRLNKLLLNLAMNRVAEVKHLVIDKP